MYDDFDAILGAAHKLRQYGADLDLDSAGTRAAVCAYIGACAAADTYYAVIPRAKEWEAMAEAGSRSAYRRGGPERADLAGRRAGRIELRHAVGRDARGH